MVLLNGLALTDPAKLRVEYLNVQGALKRRAKLLWQGISSSDGALILAQLLPRINLDLSTLCPNTAFPCRLLLASAEPGFLADGSPLYFSLSLEAEEE